MYNQKIWTTIYFYIYANYIYLLPYTNVFSRIQNKIGANTFVFVPTQKK